jgi:hypothetical protein
MIPSAKALVRISALAFLLGEPGGRPIFPFTQFGLPLPGLRPPLGKSEPSEMNVTLSHEMIEILLSGDQLILPGDGSGLSRGVVLGVPVQDHLSGHVLLRRWGLRGRQHQVAAHPLSTSGVLLSRQSIQHPVSPGWQ